MTTFDAASYARAWKRENRREQKQIERRVAAAQAEAQRLAGRIRTEAGAERVLLFGSVAEDTVRRLDFDIDLAMAGGDWSRARAIADESSFPVDLVELRRLPGHVRARIADRGIELAGSEQ
jgi:predicted nucleotidyltransferase